MASNGTGLPSSSTMLRRCRSPWQRRTAPAVDAGAPRAPDAAPAPPASRQPAPRWSPDRGDRPASRIWSMSAATELAIVVRPGEASRPARGRRDSAAMRAPSAAISSGVSAPRVGHAVEQAVLVEAAHDDQPVDGVVCLLADFAQREARLRVAPDRRHAEIDVGRQPAIDRRSRRRTSRRAARRSRNPCRGTSPRASACRRARRARKTTAPCVSMRSAGARRALEKGDELGLVLERRRRALRGSLPQG